jgi:hypothetical protein
MFVLGVNCNFCHYLALGSSALYATSGADNVKLLALSSESSSSYKGTVIVGSLGDTTCKYLSIIYAGMCHF